MKRINLINSVLGSRGISAALLLVVLAGMAFGLAAAQAQEDASKPEPQVLVSNLSVGISGTGGIQRTLYPARPGFAQAFTTGAQSGGYALSSVGIQVSRFDDKPAISDHLRVTVNGVASGGEPGDALCTLTHPSSFSTPGVITFEAPTGEGSCPQLAADTTYFVVIEWVNPGEPGSFAVIPQTYPTEDSAASDEDPGGAEGWSIADKSHYLSAGSNARTWTVYVATASFKIVVKGTANPAAEANTPATGAPTVSGTAQVGETLTADTSGISDADGLTTVSYSYQWVSSDGGTDSDISGAAAGTYTPEAGDVGRTIKVRVTFSDDAENQESLTSAATTRVAAGLPAQPTGLSVATGSQAGELDAAWQAPSSNGGSPITGYKVQWKVSTGSWDDASDVFQATPTGTSYTITDLTGGTEYSVRVMATNGVGDGPSSAEATGTPSEGDPGQANSPATGAPTINGTPRVDETLNAATSGISDADGLANVAYAYQWVRSDGNTDTDISGATGSSYTAADEDVGLTIKVRVSFTDDAGNQEMLTSQPTAAMEARPNRSATGSPTITGMAKVGETLTASTSGIADADGLDDVSYDYQWIRRDGGTDTNIPNATGSAYELVDADQGKTVKVQVSFTDDAGNRESLTSAETAAVVGRPNRSDTGSPTITGTAKVGETLTASTSGIADADGLTDVSYDYQWIRSDSGTDTDIPNATGSAYELADADQGKTIKVRVSFTDDAGNDEALTSAATAAVEERETPKPPFTVSFVAGTVPDSHTGAGNVFTLRVQFSEDASVSYKVLRDEALSVTNGTARKFKRVNGSNSLWEIHVEPDSDAAVTLTLPKKETTDCTDDDAVCTADGRPLSNSITTTIAGP